MNTTITTGATLSPNVCTMHGTGGGTATAGEHPRACSFLVFSCCDLTITARPLWSADHSTVRAVLAQLAVANREGAGLALTLSCMVML
jgi:hypothetical protein